MCSSLLADKYFSAGQFSTLEGKCSLSSLSHSNCGHISDCIHPMSLAASMAEVHVFIHSQLCCQSHGFSQQCLLLCTANSGSISHTAIQHSNCAFAEEKFSLNREKKETCCFCLSLTARYGVVSCLPQLYSPRHQ